MTVSKAVRYSLYLKPFHSVLKTVDFDKKWIGSIPDRRLLDAKTTFSIPLGLINDVAYSYYRDRHSFITLQLNS